MNSQQLWKRFKDFGFSDSRIGLSVDISRVQFPEDYFSALSGKLDRAFAEMAELERGGIANPDEKRMVGHYWLRNSTLAPDRAIQTQIDSTLADIKRFAADVHSGRIANQHGEKFSQILVVGIGGSALGPQFVTQALGGASSAMQVAFFDNTDPDGMQKALAAIPDLSKTICIVTSKSGGTKETRNGQLVAKAAWTAAGLDFAKCFVAVTGENSELDKTAVEERWLARFPMWDWVGGRTSEFSAVGLLPAALQGFQIDELLRGAREMDEVTRTADARRNPAALLAAMWLKIGAGKGSKDMVVLPYKDRLELFSRYLQQLVMESLGKESDRAGAVVNQGLAVYGNKGSTDQHAYVQQLREGLNNFFAVFIEVLRDESPIGIKSGFRASMLEVEPGITSGDYLSGFFQGTRSALFEKGRESITITVEQVSAYSVGQLIALFERAVGLYASLVNINAYHQPGVEAGKKAATKILELQKKIVAFLSTQGAGSLEQIASGVSAPDEVESVFRIVRHLHANGRVMASSPDSLLQSSFSLAKRAK